MAGKYGDGSRMWPKLNARGRKSAQELPVCEKVERRDIIQAAGRNERADYPACSLQYGKLKLEEGTKLLSGSFLDDKIVDVTGGRVRGRGRRSAGNRVRGGSIVCKTVWAGMKESLPLSLPGYLST